jgi:uncharacterized protein (DUF1684 family)
MNNLDSYQEEIKSWRQNLDDSLIKEDSWLALAGLFWLDEGDNRFGTASDNDFVLDVSSGPEKMGTFILKQGEVFLKAADNLEFVIDGRIKVDSLLKADSSGSPTAIKYRHLTFMLLEREDGMAIRLWDNQRPEQLNFPGRSWMPIDENRKVHGIYQSYQEEKDIVFSRKNGADFCMKVQGEVKFELDGDDYSFVAFEQEGGSLFTLFYDQSSGNETYSAGRYLIIDPPDDGKVIVDFNRAYNPPCAFTDYATCPLPPAQNRIDGVILAGERI